MNSCIVRYAEIGLKGKNRFVFERKLNSNIRSCFDRNKVSFTAIKNIRGRILVYGAESCFLLGCIFGVCSFSCAVNAGFNMDQVKMTALELVKDKINKQKSFCVRCQRLDKSFGFGSQDFCRELGAFICEKTKAKVDLTNPDVVLFAEIIDGLVYLFLDKLDGPGGLPLGVEGRVVVLVDGKSSLLAALLMMKRGCSIYCASLNDFDVSLLKKFMYGSKIELKVLNNLKEINDFAAMVKAKAIVVSDSFGSIKDYPFVLPVFRPLCALNKAEIEEWLDGFRQRVCQEI